VIGFSDHSASSPLLCSELAHASRAFFTEAYKNILNLSENIMVRHTVKLL